MRLIDADLFMQRIESYNTLDEKDKALYNFTLHEIVCMPTVDVLDKIRGDIFDEIKNRYTEVRDKSMIQWCSGKVSGLKRTLEIIDKYR